MSEYRLRIYVGFYLIGIQTTLIGLATYYLATGGFLFSQYTTILGFILPLFAGYLSIILKFFAMKKYSDTKGVPDANISTPFAVLSFLFPTLFGIAIGLCVCAAAYGVVFKNFEDVKVALGLGQGAFGVYIGQFVYSLFEDVGRAKPSPKKPGRK